MIPRKRNALRTAHLSRSTDILSMNRILLRLLTKPSTRYRPLLPISFHFPSARRLALMAPKRKAAAPRAPSPSSSHSEAESHDQDSPVKPAAPPPAKKPKAAPKKAAKKDADVEEEDDQEEMKEAKKPAAAKKAPIPRKKVCHNFSCLS
jgi:hypothetical protein